MLLVTGSSGPSANYFFKCLSLEGYRGKIRCIIRETSHVDHLKVHNLNLEFVYGSMENDEFLKKSFIGIKTILHIANIKFSKKIVSIGSKLGVEWFICVHTASIYSKFEKLNHVYKNIENELIRSYPNLTILRPSIIYGTGEDIYTGGDKKRDRKIWKLISFIHKYNYFVIFGRGKSLMQPVHCKDLGEAYYSVLKNKENTYGKQYNLPGQTPISYIDIIKLISKNIKKNPLLIYLPIWLAIAFAYLFSKIPFLSNIIQVEQILRMTEDRVFSWSDANNDFGYSPLSFEKGIKIEIDEFFNKT